MYLLLGLIGLIIIMVIKALTYDPQASPEETRRKFEEGKLKDWRDRYKTQWDFENSPDVKEAYLKWDQDPYRIKKEDIDCDRMQYFLEDKCSFGEELSDEDIESINVLKHMILPDMSKNSYDHLTDRVWVMRCAYAALQGKIYCEDPRGIPIDDGFHLYDSRSPMWESLKGKSEYAQTHELYFEGDVSHYMFMLWYNQMLKRHGCPYNMYLIKGDGSVVNPYDIDKVLEAYDDNRYWANKSYFVWEPMISMHRMVSEPNTWYNGDKAPDPPTET